MRRGISCKTGGLLTWQEGARVRLCAQSPVRRASSRKEEQACGHPPHGDQPQNWRATVPSSGGHQPKNWTGTALLFNLDRSLACVCLGSYTVLEFAGGLRSTSWTSSGTSTCRIRLCSGALVGYRSLLFRLVSPPLASFLSDTLCSGQCCSPSATSTLSLVGALVSLRRAHRSRLLQKFVQHVTDSSFRGGISQGPCTRSDEQHTACRSTAISRFGSQGLIARGVSSDFSSTSSWWLLSCSTSGVAAHLLGKQEGL